jgi:hypothetical protein
MVRFISIGVHREKVNRRKEKFIEQIINYNIRFAIEQSRRLLFLHIILTYFVVWKESTF